MPELYALILLMLVAGAVAGVLSGLFGIGGGLIMVPVLEYVLGFTDLPSDLRMHAAVATSLSVVIFTTASSSYAHYRRSSVETTVITRWWGYIVLGSIAGMCLAAASPGSFLSGLFGILTLAVGIKMLFLPDSLVLHDGIPEGRTGPLIPVAIGSLSSILGIGGGTLGVPALTMLSYPMHLAVGTAAFFGMLISIPATVGYMLAGLGIEELPFGYIGYVNLTGLVIICPVAIYTASTGAGLAHRIPGKLLKALFGCFLIMVSIRMIYRTIVEL